MQVEQMLLFLGLLLLVGMGMILYLLITKQQPKDSLANQMIVQLLTDMRKEVNDSGGKNRQEMQQRLDQVIEYIAHHQRSNSEHLLQQNHHHTALIKDITSKIGQIESTNRQILGFAHQMKSLEKILQNPKQRGILGEYFLETLLANVLPPSQFKMQYKFPHGHIVDAAIFVKDKIIPIDAKFSLEKYNKMVQTDDRLARLKWEKAFKRDVKNRIDETAKYVLPELGTTDFAFMFIPAEGVYYHLIAHQVTGTQGTSGVIEYAFKQKVILVSPSSFYAYLETVLQGLKALKIEDSIKEVIKKVAELGKHLDSYEMYLQKIGKHLSTTVNMYNDAAREFKKVDKDVLKITNGEQGGNFEADFLERPE